MKIRISWITVLLSLICLSLLEMEVERSILSWRQYTMVVPLYFIKIGLKRVMYLKMVKIVFCLFYFVFATFYATALVAALAVGNSRKYAKIKRNAKGLFFDKPESSLISSKNTFPLFIIKIHEKAPTFIIR